MFLDIYFVLVSKQLAEDKSNLQCTHSKFDKPDFESSTLEHFKDHKKIDNKSAEPSLQNTGS